MGASLRGIRSQVGHMWHQFGSKLLPSPYFCPGIMAWQRLRREERAFAPNLGLSAVGNMQGTSCHAHLHPARGLLRLPLEEVRGLILVAEAAG